MRLLRGLSGPCWVRDGSGYSSRTSFNIAAWHNPRSITWRWILAYHRRSKNRDRGKWFSRFLHNCGGWMHLRIPFAGTLSFNWQHPMWRDTPPPATGDAAGRGGADG